MTLAAILQTYSARIVDTRAAEHYVNGETNLAALRAAGWLKPWKEVRGSVQYDLRDLDAAIERVKVEGWPEPQQKK